MERTQDESGATHQRVPCGGCVVRQLSKDGALLARVADERLGPRAQRGQRQRPARAKPQRRRRDGHGERRGRCGRQGRGEVNVTLVRFSIY